MSERRWLTLDQFATEHGLSPLSEEEAKDAQHWLFRYCERMRLEVRQGAGLARSNRRLFQRSALTAWLPAFRADRLAAERRYCHRNRKLRQQLEAKKKASHKKCLSPAGERLLARLRLHAPIESIVPTTPPRSPLADAQIAKENQANSAFDQETGIRRIHWRDDKIVKIVRPAQ